MPKACSLDAQGLFTRCPRLVHPMPKACSSDANKIWAQAGIKALAEIADIYPRMTSIYDSSLFDDSFAMDFLNYVDKIIYCAMYLYVGYINEATNFAESQGGGGSDTKDWGREKDEDEIEWIRRCLRQVTQMVKPRKGKGLSR